eukprot:2176369-Prymnesium_polylepis.1
MTFTAVDDSRLLGNDRYAPEPGHPDAPPPFLLLCVYVEWCAEHMVGFGRVLDAEGARDAA